MKGSFVIVLLAVFSVALAEVVRFEQCPNIVGNCKVNEVRITPCPESANGEACKIRRGGSAEIQFDFTPEFDSPTLENRAYWASEIDLPLVGMETDGCKATKCPIVKGEKKSYTFSLPISRKFPAGSYDVKWRLQGANPESQECCFITAIKLTK